MSTAQLGSRAQLRPHWASRLAALGLLLAGMGTALGSFGSPMPVSQVTLNDSGSRALGRKIRAELLYAGFSVLDPPRRPRSPDARSSSARAGDVLIRVLSDEAVELYIAGGSDLGDHAQALRRRTSEASFALRVVEQLRARLVDLGISAEDAPTVSSAVLDTGPSPPSSEPIRAPTPRDTGASGEPTVALPLMLWTRGGVGGVWATGGLTPTLEGVLGASLEVSGLQLGISALVPLSSSDVSAREGEAEVYVASVALEVSFARELSPAWRLSTGPGAGLLVVSLQGEAAESFRARDDRLLAGVYYWQGGLTWSLSETVRLRGGAILGVSAPRPVLRFDQRSVASLGPLLGGLMLQVELGLLLGGGRSQ